MLLFCGRFIGTPPPSGRHVEEPRRVISSRRALIRTIDILADYRVARLSLSCHLLFEPNAVL